MLGFTRDQCRKERPSSRNFLDAGLPGLHIVREPRDPPDRPEIHDRKAGQRADELRAFGAAAHRLIKLR